MNIGLSTTMIQRGRSGVAQYVLALVRALLAEGRAHRLHLFLLPEDRPLFEFAGDQVVRIPVPERFRAAVPNV